MNYLQLCQYVQRYIAAGNDLPGSGNPTTVVGQTGLYKEIADWVADAYRDIQQENSQWLFRQGAGNFQLTSGVGTYSKATIQALIADYERIYPYRNGDVQFITATGTYSRETVNNCYYIPYEKWGGVMAINFAVNAPAAPPVYFTVAPDESLIFWTVPTLGVISVQFQYTKTVQLLTADTDIPMWPSEWHDAIAWRAIRYWSVVRESANKFALADAELQRVMASMRTTQLAAQQPTLEGPTGKDTP